MSEEKKDFDYEPTPEDLKEAVFAQFTNELNTFVKTVAEDPKGYVQYEDQIYKLMNKLNDAWSITRSYQKIIAITEKKA